jgi:hypothetical protein
MQPQAGFLTNKLCRPSMNQPVLDRALELRKSWLNIALRVCEVEGRVKGEGVTCSLFVLTLFLLVLPLIIMKQNLIEIVFLTVHLLVSSHF